MLATSGMAVDTGLHMSPNTSPSINPNDPLGGVNLAFQTDAGVLWSGRVDSTGAVSGGRPSGSCRPEPALQ